MGLYSIQAEGATPRLKQVPIYKILQKEQQGVLGCVGPRGQVDRPVLITKARWTPLCAPQAWVRAYNWAPAFEDSKKG